MIEELKKHIGKYFKIYFTQDGYQPWFGLGVKLRSIDDKKMVFTTSTMTFKANIKKLKFVNYEPDRNYAGAITLEH